jgi:hypothetical protein
MCTTVTIAKRVWTYFIKCMHAVSVLYLADTVTMCLWKRCYFLNQRLDFRNFRCQRVCGSGQDQGAQEGCRFGSFRCTVFYSCGSGASVCRRFVHLILDAVCVIIYISSRLFFCSCYLKISYRCYKEHTHLRIPQFPGNVNANVFSRNRKSRKCRGDSVFS